MGRIKNLKKIHRCKRNKIKAGMEFVERMNKREPVINRVIVFGSAIRDDCQETSDIDLCLVSDYDTSNRTYYEIKGDLPEVMDDLCDILKYDRLNMKFKRIVDQGVVVYER